VQWAELCETCGTVLSLSFGIFKRCRNKSLIYAHADLNLEGAALASVLQKQGRRIRGRSRAKSGGDEEAAK